MPTSDAAVAAWNARAEAVARAMCAADGQDPDRDENGMPSWRSYLHEARKFVAGFDALTK
jgi:hypothetical protein